MNFVKREEEVPKDKSEEVLEDVEEVVEANEEIVKADKKEEQLMIVPWRDPVLTSVVEVANYYSEIVQQEEIAE